MKIIGYLEGDNIGDNLMSKIVREQLRDLPDNDDIGIMIGGGLTNFNTNNEYYLNRMRKFKHKIALNIGVNPIYDKECIRNIYETFKDFKFVSVRDECSKINLERCGISARLYGDIVYLKKINKKTVPHLYDLLVPVYCRWYKLENQVRFFKRLLLNIPSLRVYSMTKNYDKHLVDKLTDNPLNETMNIDEIFSSAGKAITSRFHSSILSLLNNVPFVSLSYNLKCNNLISKYRLQNNEYPFGNGNTGFIMDFALYPPEKWADNVTETFLNLPETADYSIINKKIKKRVEQSFLDLREIIMKINKGV